jgi:predicted DNA-binding transcriptional regulator AlpA
MPNDTLETIEPELLTTAQTAKLLGIGERSLWRHSRDGTAPASVSIGRAVRYRRSEILEWVAAGCPRINRGLGK